MKLVFRQDINGLRAIAVLPVLFFHAQWEMFSGGFLGVDVFFVISGFLITSLIIKDINVGKFSFASFYDRRARRILPALLVTCLLTTILSFIFMLPYDLKNYGQSLFATILSANNILLYLTSGYWSLAAEFKPLYHTWSLGIEEQYYFLIPLIIFAAYRLTKNKINTLILVLFVLCLASFSISYLSQDKEFNFLMITHRMWELLVGSMLSILVYKIEIRPSNLLAFIGLFLIGFSYIYPYVISKNQAIYNLVPVVGAALVILYSRDNLFVGKLLAVKPLSLIGLLSFSIYLLHMPILAFFRLSYEGKPGVPTQIGFVLLAIPLSYLSWKYVENIFRDKEIVSDKVFYSLALSLPILLLSMGLLLHKSYGFQKFSDYSYGVNPQQYADRPYSLSKPAFSDSEKKNLLVIGNSFARDVVNMMIESGVSNDFEIIYLDSYSDDIEQVKKLLSNSDLTISVSSSGMANTFDINNVELESRKAMYFLMKHSKGEVLRIGTKNFGYNNNFVKMKSFEKLFNYQVEINKSTLYANKIERSIWGEKYIDLLEVISTNGKVPLFSEGKRFISFDTEHATKDGAIYLGRALLENTKLGGYLSVVSSPCMPNKKMQQTQ